MDIWCISIFWDKVTLWYFGSCNGKLHLVKPEDNGVVWMCFWLWSDIFLGMKGEMCCQISPIEEHMHYLREIIQHGSWLQQPPCYWQWGSNDSLGINFWKVVQSQSSQLCVVKDLSAHDVVVRLMRKENYLIGMLRKRVLAFPISRWVPGAGPTVKFGSNGVQHHLILTKALE